MVEALPGDKRKKRLWLAEEGWEAEDETVSKTDI